MIDDIAAIRLGIFLTILALMISLESLFPARQLAKNPQTASMLTRWIGNFGLLIIASIMARLLLPLGLTGFAVYTSQMQWGFLHTLELPLWLTIGVSVLLLDMLMEPGMNGLETYRKISAVYPGQKAIIASGFAKTREVDAAQQMGAGQYIKKPYMFEKIGAAIKRELGE